MSFHGYDPGDRNNWYQSPQLGLFPAGYGGGISGNYYCAWSNHLQGNPYSQAQMVTNFTQPNPYPPPPHNPSATIINGYTFPPHFPYPNQTHMSTNQLIYPHSQAMVNPEFPSFQPQYALNPSIPTFQSPSVPTFVQPQSQFTDPIPPSSICSMGNCEPLAPITGRIRTISSSSSSSSDPQTHEGTTNPSSLPPLSGVSVQQEVLRSKPAFSALIDKLEMLCQPPSVIGTEEVSLASRGRNSDEECRRDDAVIPKGTTNGVNLASTPELHPELVRLNAVPSILNLLSHDSTDLAIDAVQFHRLSDSDAGEMAVVYSTLATIENLKEFEPAAAEFVCEKIKLLEWLMGKIKMKEFDTLNVYKEMKETGIELNVVLGMPPRMAFEKLQLMGFPFLRPEDYYAKMVKSESQLGNVKSQFLVEMTTNRSQTSSFQVCTTLNLNFQDVGSAFESILSGMLKLYHNCLNGKVGEENWPPDKWIEKMNRDVNNLFDKWLSNETRLHSFHDATVRDEGWGLATLGEIFYAAHVSVEAFFQLLDKKISGIVTDKLDNKPSLGSKDLGSKEATKLVSDHNDSFIMGCTKPPDDFKVDDHSYDFHRIFIKALIAIYWKYIDQLSSLGRYDDSHAKVSSTILNDENYMFVTVVNLCTALVFKYCPIGIVEVPKKWFLNATSMNSHIIEVMSFAFELLMHQHMWLCCISSRLVHIASVTESCSGNSKIPFGTAVVQGATYISLKVKVYMVVGCCKEIVRTWLSKFPAVQFCSLSDDAHTLGSLLINGASAFLLLRVTQIVHINRAANIGLELCTDQYCWNVDSPATEHDSVFLEKGCVENVPSWDWYKLHIAANAIVGVDYFLQAATLKESNQVVEPKDMVASRATTKGHMLHGKVIDFSSQLNQANARTPLSNYGNGEIKRLVQETNEKCVALAIIPMENVDQVSEANEQPLLPNVIFQVNVFSTYSDNILDYLFHDATIVEMLKTSAAAWFHLIPCLLTNGDSNPIVITGYDLGGSVMAFFGRVGGVDLVGNIEGNIYADDPRKPAVITDIVGDNFGDIAGMESDIFSSYAESFRAALVVASISSFVIHHEFTTMLYPLLVSSMGILVCEITTLFATDFFEIKPVEDIEPALKKQLIISTVLITIGIAIDSWVALPSSFTIYNISVKNIVKNCLIEDFNYAFQENILTQGHMYLSIHYICLYSNILRYETKKIIPFQEVTSVREVKTAGIFPNAIEEVLLLMVGDKKYFFAPFLSCNGAYRIINDVWSQYVDGAIVTTAQLESISENQGNGVVIEKMESSNRLFKELDVTDRNIITHLSKDSELPRKVEDTDGYWKWFASNLASGGASSLPFVYSLYYACNHWARDSKATKNGGERQFNGLVDVYRTTLKSDGIAGLYHGSIISCVEAIMVIKAMPERRLVSPEVQGVHFLFSYMFLRQLRLEVKPVL